MDNNKSRKGGIVRAIQEKKEKRKRIKKYNKSPDLCMQCKTPLSYEQTRQTTYKNKEFGFCSQVCANSYYGKQRSLKTNTHICEKCGKTFYRFISKGRKNHCEYCISKRPHRNEKVQNLMELSKRTISKILKRADKGCSVPTCNWKEGACDTHHIIPRKKGKKNGTNKDSNIVILCPNHHRLAGENKLSIEYLQTLSIDKTFSNWKDFYLK